jgi:hypothetical protein
MMTSSSIEATRELCTDLDRLIEFAGESRVPIRALTLIERARADLQAYLDEMERTEVPTSLRFC